MAASESSRDTEIVSVIIRDEFGEVLVDFAEKITNGKVAVGILEFIESITETSVRGNISLDIPGNIYEKLQLVGYETIEFTLKTPAASRDEEDFFLYSPVFKIYDFDESTDFTDLTLSPEAERARALTIRFASTQEASVFDSENPFPYGFIGKISNTQNIKEGEFAEDIDFLAVEEQNNTQSPGIINELALRYFAGEQFEIESTDNSIMISPRKFSFPSRKFVRGMNLLQLMNYVLKYAWKSSIEQKEQKSGEEEETNQVPVPYSEYGWANYFFWQDMNGWHFKSATKMVTDSYLKGIKSFSFSQDLLSSNRIQRLDVISDFSITKAFSDGLLYAYYKRISPIYSDIYARFLDDDVKYEEKEYTYNYATDYNPMIGSLRFLPDTLHDPLDGTEKSLEEWISERKNDELKMEDKLFGYYDNRQHRDKKSINRIIGRGYDANSKDYSSNLIDENSGVDLADYSLYQDNIWQEMFDCVDIMESNESGASGDNLTDSDVLIKLRDIKKETFLAKYKYKRALQYKERWNIYRYSICCDGTTDVKNEFFAIIKNHKKIADNVFRYEWAEVSIIPKAELGFVVGFGYTFDGDVDEERSDSDIYNADFFGYPAGLNSYKVYDPDQKISYVLHIDPDNQYSSEARFGYYSGKFYFKRYDGESGELPTDEEMDGVTGSISWDNVKHLFKGESPEGLTLTFHNSQYSPFLVVEKENAIRGSTANYSGAYNLNEILNRKLYSEETYGENTPDNMTYYQTSAIDNSGAGNVYFGQDFDEPAQTLEQEHLVGPGINANSAKTEYPDAFDMMPVGGYKKVSDGTQVVCSATPFGHIVKMSSVSYDDVMKVGIEPRSFPITAKEKRFFYFATENAHDGNCTGQCEL